MDTSKAVQQIMSTLGRLHVIVEINESPDIFPGGLHVTGILRHSEELQHQLVCIPGDVRRLLRRVCMGKFGEVGSVSDASFFCPKGSGTVKLDFTQTL